MWKLKFRKSKLYTHILTLCTIPPPYAAPMILIFKVLSELLKMLKVESPKEKNNMKNNRVRKK